VRFDQNRKQAIRHYILEKIDQKDPALSKTVSETFGINQATVHNYIKELIQEGIVHRVKRGEYDLVSQVYTHLLKRSEGHLDSDTYAYETHFKKHIAAFAPNVREIWDYAFSELANNVMDHSNAANLHLLILQDYLKTTVFLTDDEMFVVAARYAAEMFSAKLSGLTPGQRVEIARKLHFDYNASNQQIRRLLKLDISLLGEMFPEARL
jgi:DNA-binding MarR family transcriptional regulator